MGTIFTTKCTKKTERRSIGIQIEKIATLRSNNRGSACGAVGGGDAVVGGGDFADAVPTMPHRRSRHWEPPPPGWPRRGVPPPPSPPEWEGEDASWSNPPGDGAPPSPPCVKSTNRQERNPEREERKMRGVVL